MQKNLFQLLLSAAIISMDIMMEGQTIHPAIAQVQIKKTRSCAALRAADLDWIVGPEYSLGRNKQKRHPGGVTTDLGGG